MRFVLAALALFSATGAHALSCLPADVARSYKSYAEAEERYTIVVGKITFDEAALPKTDWDNQQATPPLTRIPARLEGKSIQTGGFTGRYERDVTLNVQCLGPWCASGTSGMEVLAFVNVDDAPPSITLSPCGGATFAADAKTQARVMSCFKGRACRDQITR